MKKLIVILCVVVACISLLGLVSWGDEPFEPQRLCLTLIDVGQGDSLLVDLPGGAHWLVDGGGGPGAGDTGRYRVLPALRRRGIDRLDAVVVTHGDADHAQGLATVLEEIEVGELWIPASTGNPALLRDLVRLAERRGVTVRSAAGGDLPVVAAPAEIVLLHPWPGWTSSPDGENDRSVVLRVALGRVSFLLAGDIEEAAEQRLILAGRALRTTVMKVPHHASRSSSTPAFLEQTDPLVAMAGIGEDNRFGFPHASVSRRYLLRGTPLLWTGRHGPIRACTDGWSLTVERSPKEGRWEPVRSWHAREIDRWWTRGQSPSPEPPRCADEEQSWRKPEPKRTRKRKKRKKRKKKKRSEEVIEPEPTPPVLLDDREWERHRKRRRRLR
jgi:beta-lactamase superfamily II metal-dependent hydrolase